MKVLVTYISSRGAPGYENLYPETVIIDMNKFGVFPSDTGKHKLEYAVSHLKENGIFTRNCEEQDFWWVSPASILKVVEYKHKDSPWKEENKT